VGHGWRVAFAMHLAKPSKASALQRVALASIDLVADLPSTRNVCDFRAASFNAVTAGPRCQASNDRNVTKQVGS